MTCERFTAASMLEMVWLCHETHSRVCKVFLLDFFNANIMGSVRYSLQSSLCKYSRQSVLNKYQQKLYLLSTIWGIAHPYWVRLKSSPRLYAHVRDIVGKLWESGRHGVGDLCKGCAKITASLPGLSLVAVWQCDIDAKAKGSCWPPGTQGWGQPAGPQKMHAVTALYLVLPRQRQGCACHVPKHSKDRALCQLLKYTMMLSSAGETALTL